MKVPTSVSAVRVVGMVAAPLALALFARPASAQWHAQQQQQQQRQYPQQQYPQQTRNGGRHSSGAREIFEWQGNVDREIRVQMAGNRTSVMPIGSNERGLGLARAMSGIPGQDGYVTVSQLQGRGQVDVVQQPSARNGYVTIVRVRDPQSGAAPYRIAAYWQPTGNGAYNSNYGNSGNYDTYGTYKKNGRGRGHAYGRNRNDQGDQGDQGDQDDQGYRGNDRGNHKDNGLHRGQRKHSTWPYPIGY